MKIFQNTTTDPIYEYSSIITILKNSRSKKLIYTTRKIIKMDSIFSKVSDQEIASFTQNRNPSLVLLSEFREVVCLVLFLRTLVTNYFLYFNVFSLKIFVSSTIERILMREFVFCVITKNLLWLQVKVVCYTEKMFNVPIK